MVFVWVVITGHYDTIGKLSACKRMLRPLALHATAKLDKHLAEAGHLDARHRPRNLNAAHLAEPAALLTNVLKNVLVLLVVGELLGNDHVEEAENLGGLAGAGDSHARHLHLGRAAARRGHHSFGPLAGALDDKTLLAQLHTV